MKSDLLASFLNFAAILATILFPVLLASTYLLKGYCKRRKLARAAPHPLALPFYRALGVGFVITALCVAVQVTSKDASKGLVPVLKDVFLAVCFFVWIVSEVRETIQALKTCAEGYTRAELVDLRMEESVEQLDPIKPGARIAIIFMFFLTFFGMSACMDLFLGQGYEKTYSFMTGPLGWFTGLWLVFLRVMEPGPRRVAVLAAIVISSIVAILLVKNFWQPLGAAALWVAGIVGGGAFGLVYVNLEAGAFVGEMKWHERIRSLFRVLPRKEFQERKARAEHRMEKAGWIAQCAKAESGDAEAQYELGLCHETGEGAEKNYAEAYAWYCMAADAEQLPEEEYCGDLRKLMTDDQIAAGKKRAEELRARIAANRLKGGGK